MTKVILWSMAVLAVLVIPYVLGGREWLKSKPWMQWLYQSTVGDWIERTFFKKSETVLFGRTLQLIGYVLTAIASLGGVDLTPIYALLPESLGWLPTIMPLIISGAGHMVVKLRIDTATPLDVIALPEAEKQKPEIAAAIESLDRAKVGVAVAMAAVKAEADVDANAGRTV